MNNKLLELSKRRERLIQDAADQRMQLAQAVDMWREPLALVDIGVAAVGFIKKHPVWFASGSAILLKVLRPTGAGRWVSRGWIAWQLMRKLQAKFLA
jgi:YqjK-like protein